MKLKYTGQTTSLFTHGKTYELVSESEYSYKVMLDCENKYEVYKYRFTKLSLIEEKQEEIQTAKIYLAELENELQELTAPKVGQKYLNESGNKYILTGCNNKFALVCYEGDSAGIVYAGRFFNTEKEAFSNCKSCFTLIPDGQN